MHAVNNMLAFVAVTDLRRLGRGLRRDRDHGHPAVLLLSVLVHGGAWP